MSSEYARYQGKRKELQLQSDSLRLRMQSIIADLRREVDPTADMAKIRAELIHEHALSLEAAQNDLIECLEQIAIIDSIIGR